VGEISVSHKKLKRRDTQDAELGKNSESMICQAVS
jgi:hypothetical protein